MADLDKIHGQYMDGVITGVEYAQAVIHNCFEDGFIHSRWYYFVLGLAWRLLNLIRME